MSEWLDGALTDPTVTYSLDKFSCWKPMYFAHLVMAYLVFISGICAMASRLVNAIKWTHVWFGRLFILSMIWCTATAMLVQNSGLPAANLISFAFILGGMSLAWLIIQLHTADMQRRAADLAQQRIEAAGATAPGGLSAMLRDARAEVAASKTFTQRMLSWKAAHGAIMFMAWFNISGRIFASDQSGDFTCYTYPAYKPINTHDGQFAGKNLTLVPVRDPYYARLPWAKTGLLGWGMGIGLGSLIAASAFGAVFAFLAAGFSRRQRAAAADKGVAHVQEAAI